MASRPLRWDAAATDELFRVLGEGNVRSWRFLETTGVLERALPELAQAMQRRRADPFELDPGHALRWSLLDRLRDLEVEDPEAATEHAQLTQAHQRRVLRQALAEIDHLGVLAGGGEVALLRDRGQRLRGGAGRGQGG